jgi:SAM-dependent methyltransferase
MARRDKPAVQKYHDRVARRYDASYEDEFWQFHDALTWDYIKPYLPTHQTDPVLDLGCGTGKWALKLISSGYRVACVDISGAMVGAARAKVEEIGRSDRAAFFQADLCDLSGLPERQYSFAVALGDPIGCTKMPAKALKEIRKRLLDGGVLIATLDSKLAALDFYLKEGSLPQLREFLKTGRTHWLTRDSDEQFDIHTYTPKEAAKLFDVAGFDVLEMRGKTVLNMRHYRHLLADPEARREWMKVEKSLSKDADALATAGHLQIVARARR